MQETLCSSKEGIGPDTPEQISPPASLAALQARGLMLVGLSDAGRGYRMHRPCPPHGHLIVTLGGAGRVWVDGQWVESAQGTAYVSPPNVPCAFETFSGRRWRFAWVYTGDAEGARRIPFSFSSSTLVPADPKPLAIAVEGIYREGGGHGDVGLLDDWAHLIRAYTLRIVHPHPSHRVDPLAPVWDEVDARPAANWSISSLAELNSMSSESLRKFCHMHHGRSPMEHVTHLRMRRADILLQSTSKKLAVIAQMVGYRNVFAFSTAFSRVYGVPPSMRRKTGA